MANVMHLIKGLRSIGFNILLKSVSEVISGINMTREQTDRFKIESVLDEMCRKKAASYSLEASEQRRRTTLSRRVSKSLALHIGVLFAHVRKQTFPTLVEYKREGDWRLYQWGNKSVGSAVEFFDARRSPLSVALDLPLIVFIAIFVHAVLFKVDEVEPHVARTIAVLKKGVSPWTDKVSNAIELFKQWENIFPIRYVYDETLWESTNRAWETGMDGGTLRVRKDDAVYEEDMDWISTAQTMSKGSPSMYLPETARVYNHCRLRLSVHLDDVENESDELKSNENDKRDSHLQNIIASKWEQFSELSELFCVNIREKALKDEESLDDVVQEAIHDFVTGLEVFIEVFSKDGRAAFLEKHEGVWRALSKSQTRELVSKDRERRGRRAESSGSYISDTARTRSGTNSLVQKEV